MSETYQSLAHTKWDCKYHVVFLPKRRRKTLFGEIRKELGPILRELVEHKECEIVEGHLMPKLKCQPSGIRPSGIRTAPSMLTFTESEIDT
jgi:hypothetical protein